MLASELGSGTSLSACLRFTVQGWAHSSLKLLADVTTQNALAEISRRCGAWGLAETSEARAELRGATGGGQHALGESKDSHCESGGCRSWAQQGVVNASPQSTRHKRRVRFSVCCDRIQDFESLSSMLGDPETCTSLTHTVHA